MFYSKDNKLKKRNPSLSYIKMLRLKERFRYTYIKFLKEEYVMATLKITKDNFQKEVMESEVPVLIDFWAPWCGPCRMVGPVLEEISDEVGSTAKICKVNVDEEPELAASFQVMSIPMLAVVKDGKVANVTVGARPKADLLALLD